MLSRIQRNPFPALQIRRSSITRHVISISGLHVRTRAGRECHLRGLWTHILAFVLSLFKVVGKCKISGVSSRWHCGKGGCNRTWPLAVTDNASGCIVHELDSDLSDTSSGTCNHQPLSLSFTISLSPPDARENVPVRPRTRVTLTSLTGTFDVSMFAICSNQHLLIGYLISVY
jgi:hypothetical protein